MEKGIKKKLKRRTLDGKIKAICNLKFIADGIITDDKGKKEYVEGQSFRDLKAKGVNLIKIPGMKLALTV